MNDREQQEPDRRPTRAEADELENAVQEAAVTAWRIDRERKGADRLARWRRWAAR